MYVLHLIILCTNRCGYSFQNPFANIYHKIYIIQVNIKLGGILVPSNLPILDNYIAQTMIKNKELNSHVQFAELTGTYIYHKIYCIWLASGLYLGIFLV